MNKLLFTGSSGFLGLNILPSLKKNYLVDTLGISDTVDYNVNLAERLPILNKEYNVVLHAAGKAHSIPKSTSDKEEFYKVNYQGTKNLCRGLESSGLPRSFIFISTAAVYGCDSGELIAEDRPLDAATPYGKSKIQAEEYLLEWCNRNKINLVILRPSLLAGKKPPGNLGAMIEGIASGRYLSVDHGRARKSVAMADDIARLIPCCEGKTGIFNLCDSRNPTFKELEELIAGQLGKRPPKNIPLWAAKSLARAGDIFRFIPIDTPRLEKITFSLTFSNERMKTVLGFTPSDVIKNFTIV